MRSTSTYQSLKRIPLCCSLLALLGIIVAAPPAHADTVGYADSLNPVAFFSLQSPTQGSSVNGYSTTYLNGAADVSAGGGPETNAVSLNGVNNSTPEYVSTSLFGGINGAGSISAFINLAAPPTGSIEYIAGESQNGNDLDLQLSYADSVTTNLCFYTDGGSSTCGTIADTALVNSWNMVTATYNSATGNQDVYLNGLLLNTNGNGGTGPKGSQFTIGYSPVFTNRDLDGLINDVGIWNYQLSANEVATLYAGGPATSPSATPEPSSLALLGTSILGAAGMMRRRFRLNR